MNKLYKFFSWIKLSGVLISGIALFIMMLSIVADVISRNLTNASILGVYEITENYLMILVIFPSLPFVYSEGIMPKMELFFDKFKEKGRNFLVTVILIIEILVYLFMFYYSFIYAITGFNEKLGFMAGGNIFPLYPILFLMPLSFILMSVESAFIIYKNIKTNEYKLTFNKKEEVYF